MDDLRNLSVESRRKYESASNLKGPLVWPANKQFNKYDKSDSPDSYDVHVHEVHCIAAEEGSEERKLAAL